MTSDTGTNKPITPSTIREGLDILLNLLEEANMIGARVVGGDPSGNATEEEIRLPLDIIDRKLSKTIKVARNIVDKFKRVEIRL